MICSTCGNDNPRTSLECLNCRSNLNVVRCNCGFLNSLMDTYCGSCGGELKKLSSQRKDESLDSVSNHIPNFSESELMRLIELQQTVQQSENTSTAISQSDIDKLFE